MATATNLMAVGFSSQQARMLGSTPNTITGEGTTATTATPLAKDSPIVQVTASAGSGRNGVLLPQVGGDAGCLLGDDFVINNNAGTSVIVYAANSLAGSVVTIFASGASIVGTTGYSVSVQKTACLWPITSSVWIGIQN